MFSPAIKEHGRLHVRLYKHATDESKLVATSHIDPPDIKHLNPLKHLKGDGIEVDYERGTELFQRVLELLQGQDTSDKSKVA